MFSAVSSTVFVESNVFMYLFTTKYYTGDIIMVVYFINQNSDHFFVIRTREESISRTGKNVTKPEQNRGIGRYGRCSYH
jgi:pectate lyase